MIAELAHARPSLGLDAEVIIVGAGFGGLGMAMQLKRAGRTSFVILERASDVGGTWRDNTYPGCACDVPAMLYSFSFGGERDWTRLYPQQAELLAYLQRTVASENLAGHIRFNSDLSEARFDEATGTWSLQLRDGTMLRCRVIISAMGPLNKPKFPTIAGRETFSGPAFHSSQWDHTVDLRGKNVVVIGTGASAIQFVPQIAPLAGRLTVVQRTPPWIIPRNDSPVSRRRALLRKRLPFYAWLVRQAIYWTLEVRALGFVVNPELLAAQEAGIRASVERRVRDPELRAKLTPTYRAGCKRILISDDYYPTLERPNVELITEALTEIRPHAIVLGDGRVIPADVIIYGTGFEATTGFTPVRMHGRAGREIGETWRAGMEAYLGTSVTGFPNLFLVIGPNTGLGHNSMVLMMEAQYRYILGALAYLDRARVAWIDVKREVQTTFNREIQKRMRGTVWATGCSSWYQDARGKNVSLWPGFTFAFRNRTARFDPNRYTSRTAEHAER